MVLVGWLACLWWRAGLDWAGLSLAGLDWMAAAGRNTAGLPAGLLVAEGTSSEPPQLGCRALSAGRCGAFWGGFLWGPAAARCAKLAPKDYKDVR